MCNNYTETPNAISRKHIWKGPDDDLLAVDEALSKLAAQDPKKAELVKLRYFAGVTTEEAATLLGISVATAERYWTYARAWLHREIKGEDEHRTG